MLRVHDSANLFHVPDTTTVGNTTPFLLSYHIVVDVAYATLYKVLPVVQTATNTFRPRPTNSTMEDLQPPSPLSLEPESEEELQESFRSPTPESDQDDNAPHPVSLIQDLRK